MCPSMWSKSAWRKTSKFQAVHGTKKGRPFWPPFFQARASVALTRSALSGGLQQGRLCRPPLGALCAGPGHFGLFFLGFDQNRFHPTTRFHLPCPLCLYVSVCPFPGLKQNVHILSGRLTTNFSTRGKCARPFCGVAASTIRHIFLWLSGRRFAFTRGSGQSWGRLRPEGA